jgi:hypothetical protein
MLKSILTQILNRKQSNSWIVVELVLVFCLIWYIADYFFVLVYNYNIPNYRDLEHTWYVEVGQFPSDYSAYSVEADRPAVMEEDFRRILGNMRNHDDVEALGVSFWGSIPGSSSQNGQTYVSVEDSIAVGGQAITFDPEEDYFRVFGFTADNGKTPVSVRDFDWSNPNGIVAGQLAAKLLFPDGRQAKGRALVSQYTKENGVILGVVDNVKRFDHLRPNTTFYIPLRTDSNNVGSANISIRSKASVPDAVFRERFKKDMENAMPGNFYLKDITPSLQLAADTDMQTGQTNNVRVRLYLMLFFLLNILLCVLGTFWYRISTRRHETGLRRALGASEANIRRSLFVEGLLLLAIAAAVAVLINLNIVRAGLIDTLGAASTLNATYLPDRTALRFVITNGITWVTIAAVIVAAIWLPARKAAAMPPAEALHYE